MPKISLDNLERYDGHLKDWCDARFAERKVHENWHEAGPSGAVSFYPVPNHPIDPVVNFAFTETLPEGTKGPDNPSTITGVSSLVVGRCGKNLIPINTVAYNAYGITISYNANGLLVFNGTYSDSIQRYYPNTDGSHLYSGSNFIPCSMKLDLNKQYTFWAKLISGSISGGVTFNSLIGNPAHTTAIGSNTWNVGDIHKITLPAGYCDLFTIRTNLNSGIAFNNAILQFQLEEGTEATDFEPPMAPSNTKHTISLGSTYYGGSVDLSTGIMTVVYYMDVITSASGLNRENTNTVGISARLSKNGEINNDANNLICDAFPFAGNQGDNEHIRFQSPGDAVVIYIAKSRLEYIDNWVDPATAWLTQNPITVVYKLATPYTVQLTPLQIKSLTQSNLYTPRLNTVYTDADTVKVRYQKSPIVTSSDIDNAILSLGGD